MITAVVAYDENRGIGYKGKLPWHIPEDLRHFRNLTLDSTVVMGFKTYLSLGKPLERRANVVITRDPTKFKGPTNLFAVNYETAVKMLTNNFSGREIFIIGGASIYALFLPMIDKIVATEVKGSSFVVDTYFPKVDWPIESIEEHEKFNIVTYVRKT